MRFLNKSSSLPRVGWRTLAMAALMVPMIAIGCSSDSPTAPQANPQPPPAGGGATAFNISVTANPTSLPVGSATPASVTITVRRVDNGAAPGNNTSLLVTTSLGNFQTVGVGPQSVNVSLFNGSAQVNLFPSAAPGTARIQAQLQSSVGIASASFTEAETFFLQSISPTSGSPEGGSRVRIQGGGFEEPVRIFVGGQVAEVVSVTSTVITVRTPQITLAPGTTRSADVAVTVGLNTPDEATDTLPGVFTYRRDGGGALQPQIFSVTPSSGPNEGGTQVTLQGEGFASPVQVFFGSGAANAFNGVEAEVRSVSSSQILVIAPTATGFGQDNRDTNVSILVRNLNDGATALQPSAFAYGTEILITALGPNLVSYEGGARVTVSGQGFDEPVAVGAGGVGQTPISVTGTEIIFRASAVAIVECRPVTGAGNDASGAVSVTNIETGASATGPLFAYFGPDPPFITSVDPSVIAQSGGTPITLGGGNFEAPVQVTINGALTNVDSVTPTEVTLTSPNISDADFDTVECDDNGDGQIGARNIPTPNNLDFTLINVNTGCAAEGVQVAFTVTPSDVSCQGDVADTSADPPVAAFSFTVNGNDVSFSDESAGNPTSFLWEFGDVGNSTSAQQNPTFTFPGPGTYTVRLTVTNSAGSNSTTSNVDVP